MSASFTQPHPEPGPTTEQRHWESVLYGNSVDGDIEHLIATLQTKHGYTRTKARAELLRRLSQAAS